MLLFFLFACLGLYALHCKGCLPCLHVRNIWKVFKIPVPKAVPLLQTFWGRAQSFENPNN